MLQLAALIPFLPLLGFAINGLGFQKIPKNIAGIIGCSSVLASFLIAASIFFQSINGSFVSTQINLFDWIVAGNINISFSFLIDHLTLIMLMVVTGVGFLIHVYSIGYMHDDEGFGKFFAYMNLFIFFMLILVMGANYVMMFIGWEGVGLCSYLLIGFWWKNREYSAAANKAFIMNRIGDLGFILGIFLTFLTFGTSDYQKVFEGASAFSNNDSTIIAITLLFFIGAMGKSAQIPLYTWLPDAMAGPTPVSALIHAATMVTAGVYMVARSNILYSIAPFTLGIITVVGLCTAILAALIAITQSDIKKVLAYSTVSQLGYMFVAEGAGAYSSGIFHLVTHAFFKALLFLGAGSVIHAMHGEQNLRKMGGLRKFLPTTFITMVIATFAISGFPPFSGFFSKDEILLSTYNESPIVFWLLSATSVLTAVYMFRLLFLTFYGDFRGTHHQQEHLHESPRSITTPLIILAVLAAVGGFIGLPEVFSDQHWLNNYLAPVFNQNPRLISHEVNASVDYMLMGATIILLAVVIYLAYQRYHQKKVAANIVEEDLPFLYKLSYNKFYIDELYDKLFVKPLEWFGDFFSEKIEKNVIDGAVNGLGGGTVWLSGQLRKLQTGNIGFYVFAMVVGMV
ncbi:MAG: NADH-quinone oxidoreductase subunit L, partial [Chitinophagales bacterium]|nr:NADH-quinone oxidoreductase subunit L [Chitinophagales bacterium]